MRGTEISSGSLIVFETCLTTSSSLSSLKVACASNGTSPNRKKHTQSSMRRWRKFYRVRFKPNPPNPPDSPPLLMPFREVRDTKEIKDVEIGWRSGFHVPLGPLPLVGPCIYRPKLAAMSKSAGLGSTRLQRKKRHQKCKKNVNEMSIILLQNLTDGIQCSR